MGGWEGFERVRRYAHLARNYLTGHAKQTDAILALCPKSVPHENKEGTSDG